MAVKPSTTSPYHLEEGSMFARKTISVTKTMDDDDDADKKRSMFLDVIQPIIAELIGTTFFILIGLLGACNDESKNNSLAAALSFGLALMIFVASFGHISGGHFNPAVTLGVFIAGSIHVKKALLYVLMQLIGGAMGAGIFRLLSHASIYKHCHGGATSLVTIQLSGFPASRIHWWEGICVELWLTFVFVSVILMVAVDSKSKSAFAPIYIGITLCVCILASNMLTGGSFNPARSLGPAIFANVWAYHYIYWVGPLAGASLAGVFYRLVLSANEPHASEKK